MKIEDIRQEEFTEEELTPTEKRRANLAIGGKKISSGNISAELEISTIHMYEERVFLNTLKKCLIDQLGISFSNFQNVLVELLAKLKDPEHFKEMNQEITQEILDCKKREMVERTRTLKIYLFMDKIKVIISGYPTEEGQDGFVEGVFFNYKDSPGKIVGKGRLKRIDYQDIGKYPKVKKGDVLLIIMNATQGKEGLLYNGEIKIPVIKNEYLIEFLSGTRTEPICEDGREIGYKIFSKEDGVIIFKKDKNNNIRSIEIITKLVFEKGERISFEKGDIFDLPIPIEGGILAPDFKIESHENVFITEALEGTKVLSEKNIGIERVSSKARIIAKGNLEVSFVGGAFLQAKEVLINRVISDSIIITKKLLIIPPVINPKLIGVSGLKAFISGGELKNVVFISDNEITIGNKLFLLQEKIKKDLKKEGSLLDLKEKEKKAKFVSLFESLVLIKKHFARFSSVPEDFKDLRKNIFEILKKIDEFWLFEIDRLIKNVKIDFKSFNRIRDELEENKKTIDSLQESLESVEFQISEMKLIIISRLQPKSQLKIISGKKGGLEFRFKPTDDTKKSVLKIELKYNPSIWSFELVGQEKSVNVDFF